MFNIDIGSTKHLCACQEYKKFQDQHTKRLNFTVFETCQTAIANLVVIQTFISLPNEETLMGVHDMQTHTHTQAVEYK